MAKSISNPQIDEIYELARSAGMRAGKISGAGGGGFMMLLVDPVRRMDVVRALQQTQGQIFTCHFTKYGTEGWKIYLTRRRLPAPAARDGPQSCVAMARTTALLATIAETAQPRAWRRLRRGNKILFAGNGGSAADAQHLAGELVSRFAYDRPGLPAFALTTDTSVLTAIGNDYGYERLFARQVEAVGAHGRRASSASPRRDARPTC